MSQRRVHRSRSTGVVLLCVLAAACVPEDSHKLATYEIRPRFSVLATGDGKTQVTARLIAPDPDGFFDDDVRLDDHDRLFVTRIDPVDGAERRKLLHRRPGPVYQDTFTGDAQDTTFVIEFDRSRTGWTSAPDSHVTLPPRSICAGSRTSIRAARRRRPSRVAVRLRSTSSGIPSRRRTSIRATCCASS